MAKIEKRNLFSGLPKAREREVFRTLKKGKGFKIERIVSGGQATPAGEWLLSRSGEWVVVLRGQARLSFRTSSRTARLKTGDYIFIPAGTCHRVDWTPRGQKTVWLAVHIG